MSSLLSAVMVLCCVQAAHLAFVVAELWILADLLKLQQVVAQAAFPQLR